MHFRRRQTDRQMDTDIVAMWKSMRVKVVCWRFKVRHIVKSQVFYWLIIVLVFLNTIFVAVEFHRQPQFLTDFLCELMLHSYTRWPEKFRTIFLRALTLTNINRFFTVRIRRKFAIVLSLKILPQFKCVATLPCEMSLNGGKLSHHFIDHAIGQLRRRLKCVVQQQDGHTEHLI